MEWLDPGSIRPNKLPSGSLMPPSPTTSPAVAPVSLSEEPGQDANPLEAGCSGAVESMLEIVLEVALDAIAVINPIGVIVAVNLPACELFGGSKHDLIGQSIFDLIEPLPPSSQEWLNSQSQARLEGECRLRWAPAGAQTLTYVMLQNRLPGRSFLTLRDASKQEQTLPLGQPHPSVSTLQTNQPPNPVSIERIAALQQENVALQTEIQALKQAEQNLRHHEERYRSLVFATSQAVWVADVTGQAVMVTPAWRTMSGQSVEAHHGAGWLNVVHPDDREWVEQAWRYAVATQTPYEVEHRIRNDRGEERYIVSRAVPVRSISLNAAGVPTESVREWIGTSTDITDRKRAEAKLRQSEANLATAQKVARIGNWEYDLSTQKIAWSEALFHIYGLNPDQEEPDYETLFQKFFPEDCDKLKAVVERAIITGEPYEIDLRLPRTDGSIRYLEARGAAVCDENGRVVRLFGTTQDITDRKQLEELLRSQAERESLLSDVTQRIRHSLDLDAILNTTVNEVRQLLQADRVLIYRVPPTGRGFIITEAVASNCTSIISAPLPDDIFPEACHWLYCQGQSRTIVDIEQSNISRCLVKTLRQLGVKSKMVVPILFHTETPDTSQENLWGLLIAHQCLSTRRWQAAEVDFLKQLAAQVGIAIQQAELYQQVRQLNADLEQQVQERTAKLQQAHEFESTLKRITDKVRDSLDENQILQSAVEELARVLSISCCNAALFDLEQGTSTIQFEYTTALVSPSHGRVSRIADFPEIYSQIFAGTYFQFCSLVANPGRGRAAMLCCPILDDQGILGDLWLVNQPDYIFSDQDIRLVQQVANQCAIALRQARLYQASQAQVEELERLNRLKDDFLSTVSHELRTPMSNIKMATQMLEIALKETTGAKGQTGTSTQSSSPQGPVARRTQNQAQTGDRSQPGTTNAKPTDTDPKVSYYLKILKAECQREITLINDLLDLSRLDMEAALPIQTTVSLPNWVANLVEPFMERARSQQQQLVMDLPADLPTVLTHESYLERLLSELLTNACKYTPAGEIIGISAYVAEPPAPAGENGSPQTTDCSRSIAGSALVIRVSNSGTEIPEHERDRVFDKFYRIPSNDPWKHGGTGLGLALARKLAERLGGTLHLTSGSGETVFTLYLPLTSMAP